MTFLSQKMLHNRTLSKMIFAFPWKYFSGRVVKTAINLSRKKNFFFSEKGIFQVIFSFLTKPFRLFSWKFSAGLSTCILRVQRNIIKVFCRKKSLSFLDINWNIISTMAKFCWQAWQKWSLSVHEIFLKEIDSGKKSFFHRFRTPGETKIRFGDNF